MKAVILCGGKGTRIQEASEILPKPLLPIGGLPVLWHIMKLYSHYGITEFILCLGFRGWKIKEFFMNLGAMTHDIVVTTGKNPSMQVLNGAEEAEWKITLADTGEEAMTGARLWKVKKYLQGDDHFCLTYGDGVSDVNLRELIDYHLGHNSVGTVTGVRTASRFGELHDVDNVVTEFNEKRSVTAGLISGGYMVFDNKRVWDYLWSDDNMVFEKEPLPAMTKDKQLRVYKHDGFWQAMDTMREYNMLNEMWNSGEAPWKVWK